MALQIYHNPRCSKSRQTLALIEDNGAAIDIIKYLETPIRAQDLITLRGQLGYATVRDFMRTGEAIYKELGLENISDEDALIAAMVAHPKLIERPIVTNGNRAVLGRPPENVQSLLT